MALIQLDSNWPPGCHFSPEGCRLRLLAAGRSTMQFVMTAIAVVAGLVFSIAISLLVEELIFGKVFRLFFVERAAVPVQPGQKR
jgi:hypothetical protein